MKTTAAFTLLAGMALAGCEQVVDLPEPPHTSRVALFHMLSTAPEDSSFQELFYQRQLYVSNSQRVFDMSEIKGRGDAQVELRDAAGSVVERYRPVSINNGYLQPGSYRPTRGFRPQPGQAYTLRATVPGLETAESTLTMPTPATIETASYVARTPGPNSNPNEQQGRLTLILRDDPATANYYLAYARVLDQQGRPIENGVVDVDYDSQTNAVTIGQFQLSSPRQQYSLYPFADTDLNGQRITLASDVRYYTFCFQSNCPQPAFVEVHVSSITRDAYEFYLSRRRYYDSNGNPFAEPAPLASNIRPGYGLFGGATDVKYRIPL